MSWTLSYFLSYSKRLLLAVSLILVIPLETLAIDNSVTPEINQRIITNQSDIPAFQNPVCLLVGLNSTELSYREISSLSGFELFSVPYRTDIKSLVEQIKPVQIIIKHPSGFVGLYSAEGQLIRGVLTTTATDIGYPGAIPESIIKPTEANQIFENVYYPGAVTGTVPHGGVGYNPPPKGRGVARHILKLATFGLLTPFQYPGFFSNSKLWLLHDQNSLFPPLLFSSIPSAVTAAASYADSKLDQGEYDQARTQPRDYRFQPVIEGY